MYVPGARFKRETERAAKFFRVAGQKSGQGEIDS